MQRARRHVSGQGARSPPTRGALLRIGALGVVLIVVAVISYRLGWFDPRHMIHDVSRLRTSHGVGVFAVGFVVAFGIATALGFPGFPVTVIGATAIGIVPATVIYAYFANSFLEGVGKGSGTARVSLVVASVLMIILSYAPRLFKVDAPKSAHTALRNPEAMACRVDRHVANH